MGNGKLLAGGVLALLAVAFSAIGLTISHAIDEADQAQVKIEKHCNNPAAHPGIQGKIDVVNVRLEKIEDRLDQNAEKLDEIKDLIRQGH